MEVSAHKCSSICAHGRQCSRTAVAYGRGMCEQHWTHADRRDRKRMLAFFASEDGRAFGHWDEMAEQGWR